MNEEQSRYLISIGNRGAILTDRVKRLKNMIRASKELGKRDMIRTECKGECAHIESSEAFQNALREALEAAHQELQELSIDFDYYNKLGEDINEQY